MTRKTIELPPGISISDIVGGGTSGLAALIPDTRMILKFSHGDPEENERCDLEAQIYELLSKSTIPKPSSLLEYQGRSACGRGILLQYAENITVRRHIGRLDNQLPSSVLISRWAHQAAIALRFVHKNDVAHGDVTCDNFFLDKDYNLQLGDFTNSSLGLSTSQKQDDIFEFGLALYEMSTGIQLFKGLYLSPDEKRRKVQREGLPEFSQRQVKDLANTISRCLKSRFKDMEEVLRSIEDIASK